MFHFPLAWEHNDPELYDLHFWLVSCYLIQHPSIYTVEAYDHLVDLFKRADDKHWPTSYILQQNRAKLKGTSVVMNTVERDKRQFKLNDMKQAGVPVAFELFEGCYHGFDIINPKADISKKAQSFFIDSFKHAVDTYFAEQK